ncbi:MAG: phosphopantothenoylcysteine decarboxylase [Kiritimatiellia bacterium]
MKVLVTAGPTREHLDPVRFLSNRSSGRMGYALAEAARDRGHDVILVSGPVALPPPDGVEIVKVVSARDMLAAVSGRLPWCDTLIMCAAVADWRPASCSDEKLKKRTMETTLALVPNPDILAEIAPRKGDRLFIGFAAETHDLLAQAQDKLARKGLDLIVANDVTQPGAGFETTTNLVTLIAAGAPPRPLPLMSKRNVADHVLAWAEERRKKMSRLIKGIHHVALKAEGMDDYNRAIAFYRDVLGLPVVRSWENEVMHATMIDTGAGLLEIMSNATDRPGEGAVRHVALATDDVDACVKAVRDAGMKITVEPVDKVISSTPPLPIRLAFFIGPLGEIVEFFCER